MRLFVLIIGLLANVLASFLLKLGSEERLASNPKSDYSFINVQTVLALMAYGISFLIYAWCIKFMPLHVVQPLMAGGTIAMVSAGAWVFFGESVSPGAVVGVCLIVAGVFILAIPSAP